jgi:membrane protein DedA with SNARE-associated domain
MLEAFVTGFFEDYGSLVLLILPFLGQMGIFWGSSLFILLAGTFAGGISDLFVPFLLVLVAVILGDFSAYYLGRSFAKSKFFTRLVKRKHAERVHKKSHHFFHNDGALSIFLTRFLASGIGPLLNYVVGMHKFPFKKFSLMVILGEIIYVAQLLLIGYFFKETFQEVMWIISSIGASVKNSFCIG